MAFEWDHVQIGWLRRRFARRSVRFQDKVQLAGAALELDAAAEGAGPDEFFDFLTRYAVFENKAPSEIFDRQELLLCAARTCLLARRWSLSIESLSETTLVVLCARATRSLLGELGAWEIRPGIVESRLVTRVVIVESDHLPLEERTLEILIRYSSDDKVREAVEHVVESDRREHFGVLWFLRRALFQEVLHVKGKTYEPETVDIRGAVEELGVARVVDAVGLERVLEAVGFERILEAVGVERVLDALGIDRVARAIGIERLVAELGVRRIVEVLGPDRTKDALAELERSNEPAEPPGGGNPPRRA